VTVLSALRVYINDRTESERQGRKKRKGTERKGQEIKGG
jgi:hypothetical protein